MLHKETVSNVRAVVHAQPDGNDQVNGGDRVDGQAPEMHEAADVDQRDEDHEQDQERGDEVADEDGRGDKDADHGQCEVHEEFLGDDFVSFPTERLKFKGMNCFFHSPALFDLLSVNYR